MTKRNSLECLAGGAPQPRVVASELPVAFGFAVTASRGLVGNLSELVVVDLAKGTFDLHPITDMGDVWGVAVDRDENVYVTGGGKPTGDVHPEGVVMKLNRELSQQTNIPFPGLAGNASIAVGPDGAIYVSNFFEASILVLRPGDAKPSTLELEGARGPAKVAVSPAGDLLVIDNDEPGSFSTDPVGVRLLRYPVGSKSPVVLASYKTTAYHVTADAAGNVYYLATDGDKISVVKLSPSQ